MNQNKIAFVLLTLLIFIFLKTSHAENNPVGGDFELTDHNGNAFQLNQLRDQVVLLFFGYTYCPDICPASLSNVATVLRALEGNSKQVQGLFISVDPSRDTPEQLKEYVKYFSKNLIGLTGTSENLTKVAKLYRTEFRKRANSDNDFYTMDHSSNLYIIAPNGHLSTIVPYGLPSEHIIKIVRELLL